MLIVPTGTVFRDADEKRRQEARNGVQLAAYTFSLVTASPPPPLTAEILKEFQRLAINQVYRCAGHFRNNVVSLSSGLHSPPDHTEVPRMVEEMCEYVNTRNELTPVHLAAYTMWRLNWIHPFFGGNGRTARSASYFVLCRALGFAPGGSQTILELILEEKADYYAALRSADESLLEGSIDLGAMETLLERLLAKQLLRIHVLATGKDPIA